MLPSLRSVALCLLLPATLQAQVSLTLTIRNPMPAELSTWQSDRTVAQVLLLNSGPALNNARIGIMIHDAASGALVASTNDNSPAMPRFNLPRAGTAIRFGPDLINTAAITIAPSFRTVLATSSMLPEGDYEICVRLISETGETVATDGLNCRSFSIVIPDPPTLLNPSNATVLAVPAVPTFNWAPVMLAPGSVAHYRLTIAPILSGQSPRTALEANVPLFQQDLLMTSLVYSPANPSFQTATGARGFAWQVQVLDGAGRPATKNEGKSEIFTFSLAGPGAGSAGPVSVQGAYPANGDTVPWVPPHLVIRFSPYSDAITRLHYTLHLTGDDGSSHSVDRVLSWPQGPRQGQGWPDASYNDRSTYIIVDQESGPSGPVPPPWLSGLRRGVRYSWSVDCSFTVNGDSVGVPVAPRSFYLGATMPHDSTPEDGAVFARRQQPVQLQWYTNPPAAINPPDLVGVTRTSPSVWFGLAGERWQIDVSRDSLFARVDTSYSDTTRSYVTGDIPSNFYIVRTFTLAALDTGRYFWKVSWLGPDGRPYLTGPRRMFRIVDTTAAGPVASAGDTPSGSCHDECSSPAPTDRTAASFAITARDTLQIGRFRLALSRVSGSASSLRGEGSIRVPFLHAPVAVEFDGIAVNAARQVYEGTVTAKQAAGSPIDTATANRLGGALGLTNDRIGSIVGFASDGVRLVSAFTGTTPVGLPIGFDRTVDGNRYVVGVIGAVFSPTGAKMNAVASFALPWLGPGVGLGLGARDICFQPGGMGGDGNATLYLASDLGYLQSDSSTFGFVFKAATASDSGSYLTLDCHGFKALRLRAEASFPRGWFVPSPDDGSSRVRATFTTVIRNDSGFVASASMDRCSIAGAPGFDLEISDMTLDESDAMNPEGIVFPTGFTGPRDNTWRGFYIRRASVTLPEQLQTYEGRRLTFAATNLMIGRGGFTASLRAENLVRGATANVGGWGASIDTVALDFVSSSLLRGGMAGQIIIPVSDSGLVYSALMGRDTAGSAFRCEFLIHPRDTINANIWAAKLSLNPTSRIEVGNRSGRWHAAAVLNGALTLEGDVGNSSNRVPGLSFRGVEFEGFSVTSDSPYISAGHWSFASEQHGMAGFPVTIDNFQVVTGDRGGRAGAGIAITLSLHVQPGSNAISGGTTLSVWGALETPSDRPPYFVFDGIQLDSIGLRADMGAVTIDGSIRLYRADPTFGDGFRGALHANFLHQVDVTATLQVGSVHTLRYWYVDAKLGLETGIPIFSGVGLYGFGGGAWYHMRREGPDPAVSLGDHGSDGGSPGSTQSGYRFVPSEGTEFGFRAMVILGTHPRPDGFNADVAFEAEFLRGGGIGRISVIGAGYMMAGITNRSAAKVRMGCDITYDFPAQTLHGVFGITINATPFTGAGQMVLHVDPALWYLKVGEPTPVSSRVHLSLASWLTINAYLMAGMNLPAPPPLPEDIQQQLPSFHLVRNPALSSGDGFCLGAEATFDTGRKTFLIFYGQAMAEIGFDLSVLKYPAATTCEGINSTIGIDGWYAQGDLYAAIQAYVGLHVDLAFFSGDVEILRLGVAAALAGGAPNPAWVRGAVAGSYSVLGGLVSGHCEFQFAMGDECHPVLESPLAGLGLIGDLRPTDGSANVDVFTDAQASFNLVVNRPFEIAQTRDDNTTRVRTFRVKIGEFTLRRADTRLNVPGSWTMSPDSVVATYHPLSMLAPGTTFTARVTATGEELVSGRWQQATRTDGEPVAQEMTSTFTTGAAPDSIPPEQVAFSYPLNRQRFYLQGECNQGIVALKRGMEALFADRPGHRTLVKARLLPTFGGAPVEAPAQYNVTGRNVTFTVPALAPGTVYALQLVRTEEAAGGRNVPVLNPGQSGGALARSGAFTALRTLYRQGSSTATVRETNLPGTSVNPGERLLYAYWFKTSRYRRLAEKLGVMSPLPTSAAPALGNFELLSARYVAQEPFDVYDVQGFTVGSTGPAVPLVHVDARTRTDGWHSGFTNPTVYAQIDHLRRLRLWSGQVEFERYARASLTPGGLSLASFVQNPEPLLSDAERGPGAGPLLGTTSPGARALAGTRTPGAVGGRSTSTGQAANVEIEYRQGIVVPIDWSRLRGRAAWILGIYGREILGESDYQRIQGMVSASYQRLARGRYSLGFSYGYSACANPDEPAPTTTVPFTY